MLRSTLKWLGIGILIWGFVTGIVYILSPFLTHGSGNAVTPLIGVGLICACSAGLLRLSATKWLPVGLLLWGLFMGIGCVITPFLVHGWGNTMSTLVGVGLICGCSVGLFRLDPRRR